MQLLPGHRSQLAKREFHPLLSTESNNSSSFPGTYFVSPFVSQTHSVINNSMITPFRDEISRDLF